MTENHEKFLSLLEGSAASVWRVAYWLWGKGYEVRIMPVSKAPTAADWKQHSDSGDLFVRMAPIDDWMRTEVKHRQLNFTNREDFKMPDMFVCSKHSYDRANPKPYAYVVLNKAMTHAAIIATETCDHWTTREVADSNFKNGYRQVKYCCPTEKIHFIELTTKE